jgi:hypothetical protein
MALRVMAALVRGGFSQLHPAMLALLLIPFGLAALGWILVAWFIWDPLFEWLRVEIFENLGPLRWAVDLLASHGFPAVRNMAAFVLALLVVVPLWFATALVITAALAMPVAMRFLAARGYRDVERRGRGSWLASLANAVLSLVLFVLGYVLTMPFWLLPPLAVLLPWFWWSWLCVRVLRYDTLFEHALPAERIELSRRHRLEYAALAAVVTALNYIPPLFIVTPVLSALVFGHFSLSRLRELRGNGFTLEPAPRGEPVLDGLSLD